jgi:hypothetical protein
MGTTVRKRSSKAARWPGLAVMVAITWIMDAAPVQGRAR